VGKVDLAEVRSKVSARLQGASRQV
jgi:hypothetical protein